MQATALRLSHSFGIDALTFDPVEVQDPGPDEVLVRVSSVSLNYRDLMVVKGQYNPRLQMPMTIGSDSAGEVIGVGSAVTAFKAGDRVVNAFMPDWLDGPIKRTDFPAAYGGGAEGVLATVRRFPAHALVPIPEGLNYQEAATLPCAGVTAWNALVTLGNVGPGDTVLLQGTGGVSIFGLQIAKLRGAAVVITSSSEEKLARARQMGADHTINYRTSPDWAKAVRDVTGNAGVTHVLEVGGSGTFPIALRAAGFAAKIFVIGVLTAPAEPTDIAPILRGALQVQGVLVGSVQMLRDLTDAYATGGLKPVVDRAFPFRQAQEALRSLEAATHFGKVVISLD